MITTRRSTIPKPESFESYFSEEAVIQQLCKERAKKAKKRSDALFFHRIAKNKQYGRMIADSGRPTEEVYQLFPPRRLWHAYQTAQGPNLRRVKRKNPLCRSDVAAER